MILHIILTICDTHWSCQEAALRNKAMAANWLYITEGFNDNKHLMLNITQKPSKLIQKQDKEFTAQQDKQCPR